MLELVFMLDRKDQKLLNIMILINVLFILSASLSHHEKRVLGY